MADPVIELTIDPDRAFYIVVKARELGVKDAPAGPDPASNPADDHAAAVLEDVPGNHAFAELPEAIATLGQQEQFDLLVLTWIGRGDYGVEEWAAVRAQAAGMGHEHIARYLAQTPLLADYLAEGLSAVGFAMGDFDRSRL